MEYMKLVPIHPFPARMAPEIVFQELKGLPPSQLVLDPMSGSGTVLRAAVELGHRAIGFDLDPLAVLMARVWTTPFDVARLPHQAEKLVQRAKGVKDEYLHWVDDCEETQKYISFWFCKEQARILRSLSFVLAGSSGVAADAMKIALSRTIITKERGASIARDTSHSRPHRVFFKNEYDVYEGFLQSARRIAVKLAPENVRGSAVVRRGDARRLGSVPNNSVDVVITSPPYLNAIDYLRGHRLSLVWLGYRVSEIRAIRSLSIGAEKSVGAEAAESKVDKLLEAAGAVGDLPPQEFGMVRRYAQDVSSLVKELARVSKKGGRVLLVVGNSCLKGVPIWNAHINLAAAEMAGLEAIGRCDRTLPASHRYLPLPSADRSGNLARRMRTETLLSFSVC